jgi:hypothetical protein
VFIAVLRWTRSLLNQSLMLSLQWVKGWTELLRSHPCLTGALVGVTSIQRRCIGEVGDVTRRTALTE